MDAKASAVAGEAAPPGRRPGGGFGIGLPLVHQLAAANGATLSITAGPSGGTVVTVSFPPSRQIPI